MIPAECVEFTENRKICTASQNGKTYTLENNSQVVISKVKIDGCILQKDGEKRCDYLMSVDKTLNKRVFFIELKGGDIFSATEQIISTISHFENEFVNYKKEARIIVTRSVPNIKLFPKYKKLDKLIKQTGGLIKIGTNKHFQEQI